MVSSPLECALAEFKRQNFAASEQLCRQLLQADANALGAHQILVQIALRQRRYGEARERLELLTRITPQGKPLGDVYLLLGRVCSELGDATAAREAFERATVFQASNPFALSTAGRLAYQDGDFDIAQGFLERFMPLLSRLGPESFAENAISYCRAIYIAAQVASDEQAESWYPALARLADASSYPAPSRDINFCFGMARIAEKAGKPAEALGYYRAANRLQRDKSGYDVEKELQHIAWTRETFGSEFFSRFLAAGENIAGPVPVFIVGMMRSGSSLLEQILASHSQVQALGEVRNLYEAYLDVTREAAEAGRPITDPGAYELAFFQSVRERYLASVAVPANCRFFTDKMPSNHFFLWLIGAAFPQARILYTVRDKYPTVMSCYTTHFAKQHGFSESLADTARYHDAVAHLGEHWCEMLGDRVYKVRYETLVSLPETVIADVLDFVGLPMEDACLHPEKLDRKVATASTMQVKRPIYSDGNQRWSALRPYLGEDASLFDPVFERHGDTGQPQ